MTSALGSNAEVTSSNFPKVLVRCRIRGHVLEHWAIIDTGFEGAYAIPESMLNDLHLVDPDTSTKWGLANGSDIEAVTFSGSVQIVGLADVHEASIIVLGDHFILGRRITDHYRVLFDRGLSITINA